MTVVVVMTMRADRIKSTISFTKVSTQEIMIRAGTSQKKVVQSVFSTETQTEGETCLDHGVDAATDIGSNHQTNISLLGHTDSVEEG